jgi:polyhydroxybutyrate depolymerase
MRFVLLILALSLATLGPSRAAEPYAVADGTYRAVEPAGWDAAAPLPLLLYLHGYGQSSAEILDDRPLVEAVTGAGALLVVPDGLRHAWSFRGAPSAARDDLAFLLAVLEDAERRWPIDRSRIVAAGFSIGGSMVWELACHAPQGFRAFLPVAGAFWLPYPEACEGGPIDLRHIHGLSDTTVPMAGRTIRQRFRQGDVLAGFAILRTLDQCGAEPDAEDPPDPADEAAPRCKSWTRCASGRRLQLCLHPDGHEIDPAWLRQGLAWAFELAR